MNKQETEVLPVSTEKSNKKTSKFLKGIRFFVSVALIFAVGYAILNYVPFIEKYDQYVIVSGSMEPVIMIGDAVIIDHSVDLNELNEGDIIAFNADINDDGVDEVIVHYLFSIEEIDGVRTFRTKPEISDDIDDWVLTDEDILGIHVKTIPNIGSFLRFAQSTIGKIVLVFDIVIIYLMIEIVTDSKDKKTKKENSIDEPEEL